MIQFTKNNAKVAFITLFSLALNSVGWGSGFQLFEGNGINAANFSAGISAGLFDASTASYNPAGLTTLQGTQVVAAGTLVSTSSLFSGHFHWSSLDVPEAPTISQYGIENGGTANIVPALHIAHRVNDRLVVALSFTSPFGLSTDYDSTQHPLTFSGPAPSSQRGDVVPVTRYSATRSELVVIDASPSVAYEINERLSVGAGISVQYADVTFNSMAGNPALVTAFDTESANNGDSWGWGYRLGVIYKPKENVRLGLAYGSRVSHHLKGKSDFVGPLAATANFLATGVATTIIENKSLRANTVLPDYILLGAFYQANPLVDLMGTIVWSHWHLFKTIGLRGVAAVDTSMGPPALTDPIQVNAPQNFRNTWRAMVGLNYHYSPRVTFMFGAGFDQTPTNDTDRSVRLPDGDRIAVATGIKYRYNDQISIDMGYTHIFIDDVTIQNDLATGSQRVRMEGRSKNFANLLGLQFNYTPKPYGPK